jgi:ribonuclease D
MTSAFWIDSPATLKEGVSRLRPQLPLALDTEADSMYHYTESVCLISVRQENTTLLLDTLALQDLQPFWSLAQTCEWILQGADFDLRLMRRIGSPEPPSVFDTMIAAQLCGLRSFGYAALVLQHFGVTLDKGSQREDWSQRPLPQEMKDYSAQDVAYMEGLRTQLGQRLAELGRTPWHLESAARVVRQSRLLKVENPETVWHIGHTTKLPPTTQVIVRELWHWRDREAQNQDSPPFRVMMNEKLLDLAQWIDAHREADYLPGSYLPKNCRGERLTLLHAAVQRGLHSPPLVPPPRSPRPPYDALAEKRAEHLKEQRDKIALELDLEPTLIASRAILGELSRQGLSAAEKLITEDRWCPWQYELLRPTLMDF